MNIGVGKISIPYFKGTLTSVPVQKQKEVCHQTVEFSPITPDFGVNLPQKYSLIKKYKLENGLEIFCYKLANGHKVTIVPMEGSPSVVKNYVNVGSLNEPSNLKGISHFLEHMAFNGTNGENGHLKLEVGDSFKKVDEMGGWANASTNYAVTDYVNSTPQLHENDVEKQIAIIAAMTEDLKLSDAMIEKEKKPVCSEINMILDDPQTIALDQTVRTLFGIKSSTDELVGGSVESIKNLTRKDVLDYYNTHYTPDNMNLVITGDVNPEEVMKSVARNFNSQKVSTGKKFEEKLSPIEKTIRKDFLTDKATSTNIILGFKGPQNNNTKDKVLFDVVSSYLDFKPLKKYNTYPYIGNDKVSTNPYNPTLTFLAMSTADSNTEKVLKSIYEVINTTETPSDEKLRSIKNNMKRYQEKQLDYSQSVNNEIGFAILNNDVEYVTEYNKILDSITPEDVKMGVKKFFNLNKAAVTVVHPQKTGEISFKGNSSNRMPINLDKVSEYKLKNNFKVGFYETKNNNINYNISYETAIPYNKKAGVVTLLNAIYSMGTADMSEDDFEEFQENNGFSVYASASRDGIDICADSGFENRKLAQEQAKKLLLHPAINEENLKIAKERIKDSYSRSIDTPYSLYFDHASKTNEYIFSEKEILDSIDSITVEDLIDCKNYLLNNSTGIITANLPTNNKELVKKEILKESSTLPNVQSKKLEAPNMYKQNEKVEVLTKANFDSQADIIQVNIFNFENTPKNMLLANITNEILSSSSIGLFNTLREKEHLAYSVSSDFSHYNNKGKFICNILTTTDNKDIGEFSYDNVQKSIKGFAKQISELCAGNFTDTDLENAKLLIKSDLLSNEGNSPKLYALEEGLSTKYGITYRNQLYRLIDTLTKDDVIQFAQKAFKNPPIYAITASQDTLDYNEEFLESLKS